MLRRKPPRHARAVDPDEPPRGVRILHSDGTETPCEVVRADEAFREAEGLTVWCALPPEGVGFSALDGDTLLVAMMPPRSALYILIRL